MDDLLFAIIMAGIGLAGVYLKAEYALHVRSKAAERGKQLVLHELHVARASLEHNGISVQVRIVDVSSQRQKSMRQRQLEPA